MKSLSHMLEAAARYNPHTAAIIDGERKLTYLSLLHRVNSLADWLRSLGVKQGVSVALLLPNGPEFVRSFFAIAELGAIIVPLNTHYQLNELTYFLSDCKASVLITHKEFEDLCRRVLADLRDPCDLLVLDEAAIWEPVHALPEEKQRVISVHAGGNHSDEKVIYQYSSGSTGRPKRIARTHTNLIFELNGMAKTLRLSSEDKFLGVVPFSHVNGLVRSMLASMSVGATLVPLKEFKRQKVAKTIQQERITVFIGVPFMFSILAETNFREPIDFSSLRLCISASAPMPIAANRRFCEKYGFYVRQLYGSTETGSISVNMGEEIENSLESVGFPIDGVELAVLRDDGTLSKVNETGEVAVKSPAAITSYHSSPEEAEPFRDGYFFTGDLGRIDQHGYLYLVGRKKFFINKGGYKINPWEIETLLENHPKVKEVVVIGVPTPYADERVKAVIVPRRPCLEEDIINYCRGKIADYKIPSLIEFCQNLPKSPTGKLLRKKL